MVLSYTKRECSGWGWWEECHDKKYDIDSLLTGKNLKKNNDDTWISKNKGGYVEITFKQDVTIRTFNLYSSYYRWRDEFGNYDWTRETPQFDLADNYKNLKFLVDGKEKGKSPSDLFVGKQRSPLDVLSWKNNRFETITGNVTTNSTL